MIEEALSEYKFKCGGCGEEFQQNGGVILFHNEVFCSQYCFHHKNPKV